MDIFETLKKYKDLLDEGIITTEEFEETKKKLLNGEAVETEKNVSEYIDSEQEPFGFDNEPTQGQKETGESIVLDDNQINIKTVNDSSDQLPIVGPLDDEVDEEYTKHNEIKKKKSTSYMKKHPIISGVIAFIVLILLMYGCARLGSEPRESQQSSSGTGTYSDSYDSDDSDYSYDSDDSDYSSSELDYIQGSWKMTGIVSDGETTSLDSSAYGGTLDINGDRWNLTIVGSDTENSSGAVYYDYSDNSTGKSFYLYKMRSDSLSGTVAIAYSVDDDYLVVSTSEYLDADNCMFFTRLY